MKLELFRNLLKKSTFYVKVAVFNSTCRQKKSQILKKYIKIKGKIPKRFTHLKNNFDALIF